MRLEPNNTCSPIIVQFTVGLCRIRIAPKSRSNARVQPLLQNSFSTPGRRRKRFNESGQYCQAAHKPKNDQNRTFRFLVGLRTCSSEGDVFTHFFADREKVIAVVYCNVPWRPKLQEGSTSSNRTRPSPTWCTRLADLFKRSGV